MLGDQSRHGWMKAYPLFGSNLQESRKVFWVEA